MNGAVPVAIVDTKTPAVPMLPTLALPVELSVVANTPAVPMLPILALPDTLKVVNVPVEVIFGCALVVIVLAVVALPALVAYVALATVPVTLPPVILVNDEPFPLIVVNTPLLAPIFPTFALPDALIVPVKFEPVDVNMTVLATPAMLIVAFAFAYVVTDVLPFIICEPAPTVIPVS